MHQSKLFMLLRGLKSEEIRWFQKFLQSPFYNTNKQHVKLFDYIKKYYPELDSSKLSKEAACKKLFPKQAFNVQKIRKLMHGLTLLVEEFLVAIQIKNNEYQKKRLLVSELGKRNVFDLFEKGTEELMTELAALPYQDEFYFFEQFQLQKELLSHPNINHTVEVIQSMHDISKNLDHTFILEKLRLACTLQSAKKIYAVDSELPYVEEIIARIKLENNLCSPTIQFYLSIYKMFKNMEEESFFESLSKDFFSQRSLLGINDQEVILKYLINFSTYYINSGRNEYVKTHFHLYKVGLDIGCLIKNQLISKQIFQNIIISSCFLKKFDWALTFIEDYQIYLNEEIRDVSVNFNLSYLYFHQGHFLKTINILNQLKPIRTLDKILTKTLLIKSYFEVFVDDDSYEDILLSSIDAYEKFIRRDTQISDRNESIFLNFAKAVKKLTLFSSKKCDLYPLKKEFDATNLLSNKAWLLDKIA